MIQLGPEKKKKKTYLLVKPKIVSAISNAILNSKVHSINIFIKDIFNFIENTPCDSIKF